MVNVYEDYMAKVAELLGAKPWQAKIQMNQVMDFERRLARISTVDVDVPRKKIL